MDYQSEIISIIHALNGIIHKTNVADIVKASFWPIAVLIIYYTLLPSIKELLSALKEFLKSVNERGVKVTSKGIELPSRQEAEEILHEIKTPKYYTRLAEPNKPEALVDEALSVSHTELHEEWLANEIDKAIDSFLSKATSGNSNPDNKEIALKGLLCDAYIYLYFERTLNKILPGQLSCLEKLQESREHKLLSAQCRDLFYSFPEGKNMHYNDWLSFLSTSDFISCSKDSVKLTETGNEFLNYLKLRGYDILPKNQT